MRGSFFVTGGGAREDVLITMLRKQNPYADIYAAPGNAGIAAKAECFPVDHKDVDGITDLARRLNPGLTIIGPEAALAGGIADRFQDLGLPILAPSKGAARLETSKAYARWFMKRNGIKIPGFADFAQGQVDRALAHVSKHGYQNLVIKADGLWEGKGVILPDSQEEAHETVRDMLDRGKYGDAGKRILIEQRLYGRECSAIGISDGRRILPFKLATDHKRRFDGNKGPNTGGMGCYCPVPWVSETILESIVADVLKPTVTGMQHEGCPYLGFLYAGLMVTDDGVFVIEYNARQGDPEASVVWPLLEANIGDLMLAAVNRELNGFRLAWSDKVAVCVVLVSDGYPGKYEKEFPISGLDEAARVSGALVFHAGTASSNGEIVTNGGRVLDVVGIADTYEEARQKAYQAAGLIDFTGKSLRSDIAAGIEGVAA
jgi:phosphoribosylamine--glycine ligase